MILRPASPRRAWALALAAACAACAGAPSRPGAPRPVAPSATPARYGDETPEPLTPLEQEIAAALQRAPARAGARPAPALTRAARELARRAAEQDPALREAASLRGQALPDALAHALAYDPVPMAVVAHARPEDVPHLLAARAGAAEGTLLGVGAVVRGPLAHAVALIGHRAVRLQPFPREVAPGETVVLEGELVGLERPSVHVTSPEGHSRAVPVRATSARGFSAAVAFDAPGRWRLEVLGQGRGGPEVAALLTLACGGGSAVEAAATPAPAAAAPADRAQAEAQVVAAINALRARQGLAPVIADPALREVARRHSEAMAAAHAVAHVLPRSGAVWERLKAARIPYGVVFENVARAGSALEAHRQFEESPAHRENLLVPGARTVGCGVALEAGPDGDLVYLTEVLVDPPVADSSARQRATGRR